MRRRGYFIISGILAGLLSFEAGAAPETKGILRSAIYVKFTPPSCQVKAPDSVPLGTKKWGSNGTAAKFSIDISCDSPVKTSLVAYVAKGEIQPGSNNAHLLFVKGDGTVAKNSWLLLKGADGIFRLNRDTDRNSTGTGNRKYEVEVLYSASASDGWGDFSAAVRFSLIYV